MKTTKIKSASQILYRASFAGRPERIAELEQTRREMSLGLKIKSLREEAGMTQQQLAEKIGTQGSAISRIEDADYDGHSLSLLKRVADAFDMLLICDFLPQPSPNDTTLTRRSRAHSRRSSATT